MYNSYHPLNRWSLFPVWQKAAVPSAHAGLGIIALEIVDLQATSITLRAQTVSRSQQVEKLGRKRKKATGRATGAAGAPPGIQTRVPALGDRTNLHLIPTSHCICIYARYTPVLRWISLVIYGESCSTKKRPLPRSHRKPHTSTQTPGKEEEGLGCPGKAK